MPHAGATGGRGTATCEPSSCSSKTASLPISWTPSGISHLTLLSAGRSSPPSLSRGAALLDAAPSPLFSCDLAERKSATRSTFIALSSVM